MAQALPSTPYRRVTGRLRAESRRSAGAIPTPSGLRLGNPQQHRKELGWHREASTLRARRREIAFVFVRFDHVARRIVNANHSIIWNGCCALHNRLHC